MPFYNVASPLITENLGYMQTIEIGPPEQFCCLVDVQADNKRDAKIKAVKHREFREWVEHQKDNNANPFTGLRVVEIPESAFEGD